MPRRPKRPCRMTGCPNLTDRKSCYCETHEKTMQRHYDHFARGYDQHERYGSAWRRIRDRHLAGHPLCESCKEQGRYVLATLVHHVRPLSDGGTHDEDNLMSLCVSCHEKIHSRRCEKIDRSEMLRSKYSRLSPSIPVYIEINMVTKDTVVEMLDTIGNTPLIDKEPKCSVSGVISRVGCKYCWTPWSN